MKTDALGITGASQSAAAEECSAEMTHQIFALNTLGPILLTRALLPHMLARRRGRFVVIASMASKVPSPGQSLYAATKQGLFGFFASVATEVADRGVTVTIACPGPIFSGSLEPRTLFGPEGLVTRPADASGSSKKVTMARAVHLICSAAAHGLDEVWIAKHPVLLAGNELCFKFGHHAHSLTPEFVCVSGSKYQMHAVIYIRNFQHW